jgi:hypothetical protein
MRSDSQKDRAQLELCNRTDLPEEDEIYRHYKGGLYVVKGVGILESLSDLLREVGVEEEVIARIPDRGVAMVLYHSNARGTNWVRTLKNFQDHVQVLADPGTGHSILESVPRDVPRFRRETQ